MLTSRLAHPRDDLLSAGASGHRATLLERRSSCLTNPLVCSRPPPPVSFRQLPERPHWGQLRKQAKDLRTRYAAADPETVAEVRRFYRPPDDSALTLVEAQLVLARSYGFDSWPKLKAHVDRVDIRLLETAVRDGELQHARAILERRPELVNMQVEVDGARPIHLAVLADDAAMLRLLMERGANARQGVGAHRGSTTALQMATDPDQDHLAQVIRDVEAERQAALSCPNTSISTEQAEVARLIREGRDEEAIALLDSDPVLLKICDRDGATLLHVASGSLREAVVDWLCDHRADARKRDAVGLTPIDRAVLAVDMSWPERLEPARRCMARLVRRGAETTPLAAAATGDLDRLVQLHAESLEQLRAEYRWQWGGRGGVLSAAAVFDQVEAVRLLLDLGLDPDEPIAIEDEADEAWSWGGPLWRAASFGRLEIARLLLDRGADPNATVHGSGWVLDRAKMRNDRAMIDLLVERGATPSLYLVCGGEDLDAVDELLSRFGDDAVAAREMVWAAAYNTRLAVLDQTLPRLVALRDRLGDEALKAHDLLCQPMRLGGPKQGDGRYRDRFVILQRLLDTGLDPNIPNPYGMRPLHFAIARGGFPDGHTMPAEDRARFVKLLLDGGADPSLRDDLLHSSALGWACRYGKNELVKLLLERGVAVDERGTPDWAQPRAWAEKMGHDGIVAILDERVT